MPSYVPLWSVSGRQGERVYQYQERLMKSRNEEGNAKQPQPKKEGLVMYLASERPLPALPIL